jgi:hypothetical protein
LIKTDTLRQMMKPSFLGSLTTRRSLLSIGVLAVASALVFPSLNARTEPRPELLKIKTVYFLPMGNGLDQYLANWLTRTGRFEVVTDPALAEAVFTDRLGAAFELSMKDLYPPAEAASDSSAETPAASAPETAGGTKVVDPKTLESVEPKGAASSSAAARRAAQDKADADFAAATRQQPARISSWGRSKGNLFLVDRGTRKVIWSFYGRPANTTPDQLDRLAEQVSRKLHSDVRVK